MKSVLAISGLKCDNPGCGYVDKTIPYSDYPKYIDAPCPKCGHSLLTRADYEITKMLVEIASSKEYQEFSNFLEEHGSTINELYSIELNGTGKVNFVSKGPISPDSPEYKAMEKESLI